MLHPRLEPGLEDDPLGIPGVVAADQLHGHGTLEASVPAAVNLAHPARAEQPPELDLIVQGCEALAHRRSSSAARIRRETSSSSGSG